MKHRDLLLVTMAGLVILLIGPPLLRGVQPPSEPPEPKTLPGTYVLQWQGVTDSITLLPGGRFRQSVHYKDGKTYHFSGKWWQKFSQYQVTFDQNLWFALGSEGVNPISPRAGGDITYEIADGNGMKLWQIQGGSEDYFYWVKQK